LNPADAAGTAVPLLAVGVAGG